MAKTVPVEVEVKVGIAVQDGDTLVIAIERRMTSDELTVFRSQIREHLPETVKVLIVEGAAGLARYRSDGE